MTTQIQQEIQETIQKIVHLERVDEQLKVTKKELTAAYEDHKSLDRKLRRELRDIERLEGLSTKAIFHKILGNKEKQLEKERQEYLELSLREQDTQNSIKLLEYEVNLLEAKLGSKPQLLKHLEILKTRREEEIIKTNPELRGQLLRISNKLENSYQFKVELNEAIDVGQVCLKLTNQIISHLSKVRNWGHWNHQGRRRSQMGRMMHREAIDRARNLTYQIKHHLNLFANELNDLGKRIPFQVDTSNFVDFSEFFFNNIITDWILQQQLTKALGSANLLQNNLKSFLSDLNQERERMNSQIQELNNNRDQILIS